MVFMVILVTCIYHIYEAHPQGLKLIKLNTELPPSPRYMGQPLIWRWIVLFTGLSACPTFLSQDFTNSWWTRLQWELLFHNTYIFFLSSQKNILSFVILFLNDSVTQFPGPRPPITSFLQKQLNGLPKPHTNIGLLPVAAPAFVLLWACRAWLED